MIEQFSDMTDICKTFFFSLCSALCSTPNGLNPKTYCHIMTSDTLEFQGFNLLNKRLERTAA